MPVSVPLHTGRKEFLTVEEEWSVQRVEFMCASNEMRSSELGTHVLPLSMLAFKVLARDRRWEQDTGHGRETKQTDPG